LSTSPKVARRDPLEHYTGKDIANLLEIPDGKPDPEPVDESLPGDAIGLKLKCGETIVDKEQGWIVDQFLPNDTLIVIAGQVGLGKTTACMDWGASITNGRVPILGGKREARNFLMLSNEDSEAQLRRFFVRLGGNLSRLFVEDEDSDLPWGLGDVPALAARMTELRPALVVIDSLTTHKPSKVDLNSHGDVAPMLVALRKLAATHSCAIVVIHHINKGQTSDPLAKISGSIGISATARHVIMIAPHPEDPTSRVAAIAKTNLVKFGAPSYKFKLDPFGWDGEANLTASDLLQAPSTEDTQNPAEIFLQSQLAEGPKSVKKLEALGNTLKISRPTLYRAKKRLHIISALSGYPALATWSLPPQSSHQSSLASETETTGDYSRDNNNNNQCLQGSSQSSQLCHEKRVDTTGDTTANLSPTTDLDDNPSREGEL
jgi:hypothetical protein